MSSRGLGRALGAVHLGWGIACLAVPGRIAALAGTRDSGGGTTFVRILGGRHIAAGLGILAIPTGTVVHLAAVVDAIHATTMVGWAVDDRRERGPAAVNAAAAAGWSVAGRLVARRMH